jgi:hypothetical protein
MYPVQNLYQRHLSTANLTLTDLGSNPGHCSDRPATNRSGYFEIVSALERHSTHRTEDSLETLDKSVKAAEGNGGCSSLESNGTYTARKTSRAFSVKHGGAYSCHYALKG